METIIEINFFIFVNIDLLEKFFDVKTHRFNYKKLFIFFY